MVNIDLTDRKIHYEHDIASRQPLSQLDKKVDSQKDMIAYRTKFSRRWYIL